MLESIIEAKMILPKDI